MSPDAAFVHGSNEKLLATPLQNNFLVGERTPVQLLIISALETEQREAVSDALGIANICHSFYSKLYLADPVTAASLAAREEVLAKLTLRIMPSMQAIVNRLLMEEELHEACIRLAHAKSPGQRHCSGDVLRILELLGLQLSSNGCHSALERPFSTGSHD